MITIMAHKDVLALFKEKQATIYEVASVDFQYDDEAISGCVIKQFQRTGEMKFKCAGELIGMLLDHSREDTTISDPAFSMKAMIDSLPPPSPRDDERRRLEEETKWLWIQQFCLLCCRRTRRSQSHYSLRCALLLPCTHLTTCISCAYQLRVCNICKTPIHIVIKTYR